MRPPVLKLIPRIQALRAPATALELAQGNPFDWNPAAKAFTQRPIDPGLKDAGWINPYRAVVYPFTPDNVISFQGLPANRRRTYLVIQNKGPGNLFVAFDQAADPLTSVTLVPSQAWEIIGGAAGGPFVPSSAVWVLTDTLGTTGVFVEGVSVPVKQPDPY